MNQTSSPTDVRSGKLTIVADDLTGALDAAGSFASPEYPVSVFLDPPVPEFGRIALDTDSRDLPESEAVRRVAEAFGGKAEMGKQGIVFKKIDSVMRGHPAAEAVTAFRAGGFDRALFAPAFPGMGRTTLGGRQHVVTSSENTAVGPPLIEALSAFGVPAAMIGDGSRDHGFFVADASTQADLEAALETFGSTGRVLYVGTGGLAAALAGSPGAGGTLPPIDLAICGTLHPVTARQVEALAGQRIRRFHLDGDWPKLRGPSVFIPPRLADEGLANLLIERSLQRLVGEIPKPGAVLVTGGWTLRLLGRICGAERLDCVGLYATGIPICRVVGGFWDEVTVISKSGGFGSEQLLSDLFALRSAMQE